MYKVRFYLSFSTFKYRCSRKFKDIRKYATNATFVCGSPVNTEEISPQISRKKFFFVLCG